VLGISYSLTDTKFLLEPNFIVVFSTDGLGEFLLKLKLSHHVLSIIVDPSLLYDKL